MKVIKSVPRGYCHGVVNALNLTSKAIKEFKSQGNIYILGEIVHNKQISKAFLEAGAITLQGDSREKLLEQVHEGTIIITAHGISPKLLQRAKNKNLNIVDATCKDVYKTHNIVKKYLNENYSIIYIGKKNHPEPEGVLGIDSNIHLVSNKEDIDKLQLHNTKIIVTNQTTMSKYDIKELFKYISIKFPAAKFLDEICNSTSVRQEIANENAPKADISFVVGDKFSNNTNKLVEICEISSGKKAYRIDTIENIDIKLLLADNINTVHITSGASTPTFLTTEVIKFFEIFDKNDKNTWNNKSQVPLQKLIPRIR